MKTDIKLLYRDKYLTVCIKPQGVRSEGESTAGYADTAEMPSLIRAALNNENAYVGTVHRLDKNVSGLMVYSLDKGVTGRLTSAFAERTCQKQYYAAVIGKPENPSGVLTDLLFHDGRTNKTFVVKKQRAGVKKAELEYNSIGSVTFPDGRDGTILLVTLRTGRTHQIRVQFSSRGLPIYGDGRYGGGSGGIWLFSAKLSFCHPITGEALIFSEMPENEMFREAISQANR